MKELKKILRKALFLNTIEDLSMEERRKLWPPAKSLKRKHIDKCKLITNRNELLNYVPRSGICAEIGIDQGDYSEKILHITNPKKLHLFDISSSSIRNAEQRFSNEIEQNSVEFHLGDSSSRLGLMPDNYFDWVYIDGDHSYDGCKNDLLAVRPKMKSGGLILLNDYTYFGPSNFKKFGVVEAVNEFCLDFDYEILYMALQSRLYNDVLLKPMNK